MVGTSESFRVCYHVVTQVLVAGGILTSNLKTSMPWTGENLSRDHPSDINRSFGKPLLIMLMAIREGLSTSSITSSAVKKDIEKIRRHADYLTPFLLLSLVLVRRECPSESASSQIQTPGCRES